MTAEIQCQGAAAGQSQQGWAGDGASRAGQGTGSTVSASQRAPTHRFHLGDAHIDPGAF